MAALELDHRALPLNPCSPIAPQANAKQSLRQNQLKPAADVRYAA
jgi:hypothetical protein